MFHCFFFFVTAGTAAAASDILSLGCHVFVLLWLAPGADSGAFFPWHGFWHITLFLKR